jgi:TPR repeat protein
MYANGQGIPPNGAEAYFWATLAGALGTGEDQAKGNGFGEELAAELSPSVVERTRARAATWLADFQKRRPRD